MLPSFSFGQLSLELDDSVRIPTTPDVQEHSEFALLYHRQYSTDRSISHTSFAYHCFKDTIGPSQEVYQSLFRKELYQ